MEHVAHAVTIHHQRAAAYKTFRDYHAGRRRNSRSASDHFKAEQAAIPKHFMKPVPRRRLRSYTDRLRISTWGLTSIAKRPAHRPARPLPPRRGHPH